MRSRTLLSEIGAETGDEARPLVKSAVGLYSFSPRAIATPKTEIDLVEIVRYAKRRGLQVRAIGALHSAVPLPATQGLCISLEHYNKVLQVDSNLVTVQAGIRLWALNDFLAENGLALPTLGTIAQQTAAGAIATGTHGGSLQCQSLSGYVRAMRLVSADGQVVTVRQEDGDLGEAALPWNGVAIALGSLGLISTVTFQCVPAFSLSTERCTWPMTSLLANFDTIHQSNQYVDIRYSPVTDDAHAALINPTSEPLTENGGWEPTRAHPWIQHATDRVNKLAQRLFLTHRFNWLQRWAIARYNQSIYTEACGRSDFVLTHFDATSTDLLENETRSNLDPVADMEVAVPYHQAVAALSTLRDHFRHTKRFPSMSIHIRTQAAEPFWLSPTRNSAICWIEFWEYPCTGKFFAEMMTLLAPFDPVGHWGKQLPKPPQEQYAKWREFVALRQVWDPQGMFSNDYLDQVLGPANPGNLTSENPISKSPMSKSPIPTRTTQESVL